MASITGAPVKLEALEVDNIYGPSSDISAQLMDHYTANIKTNLMRVAFSTDLIGNPYNFVNTMGTGIRKFYYEPKDGFMEGPLSGGIGMLKGTAGVITTTTGAVIGLLGNVSKTLGRATVSMTFDDNYVHDKELKDIKQMPSGALDGMGKGVIAFGEGFVYGLSGLVVKPYEGAKEENAKGFLKGVGKGVTGLLAKPLTGVTDLVTKTSQGIEMSVQDKINCA